MKTWHKIVIGCGIFLIFSCIIIAVLMGIGGYKIKGLYESYVNPEATLKRARNICDFNLPQGYNLAFSTEVMDFKMAMINHTTNQSIILMQLPKESRISVKDFKKMLNEDSKEEIMKKINEKQTNSKITAIKEIGLYNINEHEIPYCKAEFEYNGKPSDGILVLYECPISGKNFFVMSMADKGKYSEDVTLKFLKCLKCH